MTLISYKLEVLQNGISKSQGTAWFVHSEYIVTAFHVVGERSLGWFHERKGVNVEYRLVADLQQGKTIFLEPVDKNENADIAVLKTKEKIDGVSVLPLGDSFNKKDAWETQGFPKFHEANGCFPLTGEITAINGDKAPDQQIALLIDQGTQLCWEGVSGAPVISNEKVIGMITNMTDKANTGWACEIAEVKELLPALITYDCLISICKKRLDDFDEYPSVNLGKLIPRQYLIDEINKNIDTEKILVLYGKGGFGKTSIILQYANYLLSQGKVCYFSKANELSKNWLDDIIQVLGIRINEENPIQRLNAVIEQIRKISSKESSLIIQFNIDDASDKDKFDLLNVIKKIKKEKIFGILITCRKENTAMSFLDMDYLIGLNKTSKVMAINEFTDADIDFLKNYNEKLEQNTVLFKSLKHPLMLAAFQELKSQEQEECAEGNYAKLKLKFIKSVSFRSLSRIKHAQLNNDTIIRGIINYLSDIARENRKNKFDMQDDFIGKIENKFNIKSELLSDLYCEFVETGLIQDINGYNWSWHHPQIMYAQETEG